MREAHAAARRPEAPAAAPAPVADADRRIDAIAERYDAGPRRGPRIRWLVTGASGEPHPCSSCTGIPGRGRVASPHVPTMHGATGTSRTRRLKAGMSWSASRGNVVGGEALEALQRAEMRRGVFCRIEPVGSASALVFGATPPCVAAASGVTPCISG